jgi:hypothetical protein
MLKRNGYDAAIYHQRNKTETIFSVIKKMFGENVTSRKISTQNRELFHRVIAYNAYRITRDNLLFWHGFYTAIGSITYIILIFVSMRKRK